MAASHADLRDKLKLAHAAIAEGRHSIDEPRGVVFEAKGAWANGKVAFLFPGQGAQSPGMLRELAVIFPAVRDAFEEFDRVMLAGGGPRLGPLIFAPPAFSAAEEEEARRALLPTEVAQPAVGAACLAICACSSNWVASPTFLGVTVTESWWRSMPRVS